MKRVWLVRATLVLGFAVAAGMLVFLPTVMPAASAGSGTFARKDLFLALIALGALGVAAIGFDLGEWL